MAKPQSLGVSLRQGVGYRHCGGHTEVRKAHGEKEVVPQESQAVRMLCPLERSHGSLECLAIRVPILELSGEAELPLGDSQEWAMEAIQLQG